MIDRFGGGGLSSPRNRTRMAATVLTRAQRAEANRYAAQGYQYGIQNAGYRPQFPSVGGQQPRSLLDYYDPALLRNLSRASIARLVNVPLYPGRVVAGAAGQYRAGSGRSGRVVVDPFNLSGPSGIVQHEGFHALELRSQEAELQRSMTPEQAAAARGMYVPSASRSLGRSLVGSIAWGNPFYRGAEAFATVPELYRWSPAALPANLRSAYRGVFRPESYMVALP